MTMPMPPTQSPSTEVIAAPANDRRQRRRFSRQDKLRILADADAATERGALAALLRREGIYSSHLSSWRRQLRERGEAALDPGRPGPVPTRDERGRRIAELERKNQRLERDFMVARKLIDLAVKAHEILGVALPSLDDDVKR